MEFNKYNSVKEFIKDMGWANRMSRGGLDGWNNYMGPDLSDWVILISKSRDAGPREESNFEVALKEMGGEKEGRVEVFSFGHWACGHIDAVMIHKRATFDLVKGMQIRNALENYPVLDDSDMYEREHEEDLQNWDGWARGDLEKRLGEDFVELYQTELRDLFVNTRHYSGEASTNPRDLLREAKDLFHEGTFSQLIVISKLQTSAGE